MSEFISVDFTDKICAECNEGFDLEENIGVYLQCGCSIHSKCIVKICENEFGDEMNLWSFDKRKMFDIIEQTNNYTNSNYTNTDNPNDDKIYRRTSKDSYQIMCFGTSETDGIILCPACNLSYSILSPIYRDFSIPKLIQCIVFFVDEENNTLIYHLCTNIDLVHLVSYPKQKNILNNFDYEEENVLNDILEDKSNHSIEKINSKHFFYHAVIVNDNDFIIFEDLCCPVCNVIDDIENKQNYKHSTINDFIKWQQLTYNKHLKYIFDTTDDENTTDDEKN